MIFAAGFDYINVLLGQTGPNSRIRCLGHQEDFIIHHATILRILVPQNTGGQPRALLLGGGDDLVRFNQHSAFATENCRMAGR